MDTEKALILLGALGADIFLICSAKSKLVKVMWGFFGGFIISLGVLMIVSDYLYSEPKFHTLLFVLAGLVAAFFIGGVLFAYITLFKQQGE